MRRLDHRGRVTFIDIAREAQCPKVRTAMLLRLHAREKGGDILTGGRRLRRHVAGHTAIAAARRYGAKPLGSLAA